MYTFKFADIGEGLHEGTVGEVYLKVGDSVKEGESLFSVETDKVTTDIPSPVDGKVTEVRIATGDTVKVGDEIFVFDDGKGAAAAPAAPAPKKEEAKSEIVSEGGGAASVVGDIKVSNDVFSFDMFKKGTSKPASKPAAKAAAPAAPQAATVSGIKLPNPSSVNPTGTGEKVDVVVIGAGPGGYDLAERLAHQGLKVVSIEDRFAGGVCLNIGCIPTKALLKDAKVLSYMKHGKELGIDLDINNVKVNWTKMQERKTKISNQLKSGIESLFKMAKVEYVNGRAEVIDRYNVKVNEKVYTTKYIVVATGSFPIALPLEGFDKARQDGILVDSTGALSFERIPASLAIIGGGVIGIEFATLYNELGTKVTILEGTDSILGPLDGEVKRSVKKLIEEKGIRVLTGAKVKAFKDNKLVYELDGKDVSESFDKVLESVGRRPQNIGIDKAAGVKLGARGEIVVNDIMQTNVDNIFAIGDVVGHAMLAHTAYRHSKVVAEAFEGKHNPYNRNRIPGVIYIYPEISSIGYTEEELKAEKIDYIAAKWQNQAIGRALAENDTFGFTKLLVDPKYGQILGAHIVNATSSEMISEIATAMELEGTVYEIANTTHPHPTTSEGIWEAANVAVSKLKKSK